MYIVFLGAPGVGKGTMATRVSEAYGIPHMSTGDIFRAHIRNKTDLGKQVTEILRSGQLVPDSLTIQLVASRLKEPDIVEHGALLDGFPRTVEQATALDDLITLNSVILFSLDERTIIERLTGRRVHPASGRVYHIKFNPPRVADTDDITGEPLVQRPDDQEQAIKQRIDVYTSQTAPLIAFYQQTNRLQEIDASPSPDALFAQLTERIAELRQ